MDKNSIPLKKWNPDEFRVLPQNQSIYLAKGGMKDDAASRQVSFEKLVGREIQMNPAIKRTTRDIAKKKIHWFFLYPCILSHTHI